tara:strand:- start:1829 stop:2521 length:693 start_codon:yes stop_codon:yes gene_type:complete
MKTMNKVAFRYLFEIFVIIFSVTISFYIQDLLNEQEKIELKNAGLVGVLSDIDADKIIFNNITLTVKSREASIFQFLEEDQKINNNTLNGIRRYFGFVGNKSNYNSMVATGSIEFIRDKKLFNALNNFYSWSYSVLIDQSRQDEMMYWKFVDYTEKKYKIDSVKRESKNSPYRKIYYNIGVFQGMKRDLEIRNQLNNQLFSLAIYDFFAKQAIERISELKTQIELELSKK